MSITEWTLENRTFSIIFSLLLIVGGMYCYQNLGRLEDPEFAIKEALVITGYPGASPQEVSKEVTEPLETAIQGLGQLKELTSLSREGVSTITVKVKDKYDKASLPQVWDELRRKVHDAQKDLPPDALTSIVNDDYGDVYGVLISISGPGYSLKELDDTAYFLKRELLLVKDVAKATVWGVQQEQVIVEISRARMTQLGISLDSIYKLLSKQNFVSDAGSVRVGSEYIRINPSGEFSSVEQIGDLVINTKESESTIYLKDIAKISREYISPPSKHLRYNHDDAIALGFSTVAGGNVVVMGDAIKKRIKELSEQLPTGIQLDYIYYQADEVEKSVNAFLVNLVEALVIVIAVLMIFMGLRSGLLIGTVLLLTVCSTFVFMYIWHIDLQRISLGALIIALGMLVDNAIVVTEGILIRIQQGMDKIKASIEVVDQTKWPLFGATVIAILAFAAIGLSEDSTGEYTRSLFQVLLISLGLSWIIAITVTPLFCCMFLKKDPSSGQEQEGDVYKGVVFTLYRLLLKLALRFRLVTLSGVVALLALGMVAFNSLESSFFPNSTSPLFYVHLWLPEGTDIRKTSEKTKALEGYVSELPGVESVTAFVGGGAPRYMLVYSPEKEYTSYAVLFVKAEDYKLIDELIPKIGQWVTKNVVDANPKFEKVRLGPGGGFSIEARFIGADPNILRGLANQAKDIMHEIPNAYSIRDDWRQRVNVIRPNYSETKASRIGITRDEVSNAIKSTFSGLQVGLYREGKDLIPIMNRAPKEERDNVKSIQDIQIWSDRAGQTVPLRQALNGIDTAWEDAIIHKRDKKLTVTAQADPKVGNASVLLAQIKSEIEAIELPIGYALEWGGEFEDSRDAQIALKQSLPTTFLLMVLITIALFNSVRQPLIIWLTVPLSIIGVSFGLWMAKESFGFMAILGFLSLSGMMIKNAIVLLDEIDCTMKNANDRFQALIEACTSRLRPVSMAALTTILGMIPLLQDVFFVAMAVTIMSGLLFATVLTLVIVPVFYSLFFNIKEVK